MPVLPFVTVKVAPGARSNSLSPAGRGRGEGTALAPATFMFWGGAGAMAVRQDTGQVLSRVDDSLSCQRRHSGGRE